MCSKTKEEAKRWYGVETDVIIQEEGWILMNLRRTTKVVNGNLYTAHVVGHDCEKEPRFTSLAQSNKCYCCDKEFPPKIAFFKKMLDLGDEFNGS